MCLLGTNRAGKGANTMTKFQKTALVLASLALLTFTLKIYLDEKARKVERCANYVKDKDLDENLFPNKYYLSDLEKSYYEKCKQLLFGNEIASPR